MKEFWDFIVRNKFIIICVSIVVLLYATGIMELLWKLIVLIILVILAVYVGKKLQENDKKFTEIFKFNFMSKDGSDDVYYYQEKDEKKEDSDKK